MPATLYYTPTSCGAASFISSHKAGILGSKLQAFQVDLKTHTLATGPNKGKDFYSINPKGNVPCIVLEDGTILNENAATLQWIADQNPSAELAPANGTSGRYLVQSKLSYVSSEIHATCGGLFNPALSNETREYLQQKYATKLTFVNTKELANKKFLAGDKVTVADIYFYIILTWSPHLKVDLSPYPAIQNYFNVIQNLDWVQKAKAAIEEESKK